MPECGERGVARRYVGAWRQGVPPVWSTSRLTEGSASRSGRRMWQTRGDEKLMRRVHGQRQVREWVADGRGSEDAGGECGGTEVAMG